MILPTLRTGDHDGLRVASEAVLQQPRQHRVSVRHEHPPHRRPRPAPRRTAGAPCWTHTEALLRAPLQQRAVSWRETEDHR